MLRRIWEAIKDACTPHPERFDDPTDTVLMGVAMEDPLQAPPIEAAVSKTHQEVK